MFAVEKKELCEMKELGKNPLCPRGRGENWTITFVRVVKVTNSWKCYLQDFTSEHC